MGFDARCDQHDEGVAGLARADLDVYVLQTGRAQQGLELAVCETEALVAEPAADPSLIVFPQVEDEQASGGTEDPHRLRQRIFRIGRVMQCLGQQGDVH